MLNPVTENRHPMHLESRHDRLEAVRPPESIAILLSRAVETLQDSLIVTDTVGTIQYVNVATERLFRLDAPTLIGFSILKILSEAAPFGTIVRRALLGGWQGELTLRQGGNFGYGSSQAISQTVSQTASQTVTQTPTQTFTASVTVSGIHDAKGQPVGMTFIFRDITIQKQRELELERSNQLKSDFLAHMSHELRTPLTSILGFSSVLQKQVFGLLNPKQAQYTQQIYRSGQHLLSLINDVLDLSKIEAGQMELELELTLIEDICQSAIDLVSEQARLRNLQIHHQPMPGKLLAVDELRLRQVLINLLANAIKFSHDDGELGIAISDHGRMIAIEVWDQGIGIPANQQHRLFQPFQQISGGHNRMGTGLGLALSRRLVELHQGYITVESQEGKGSKFTIYLPT
jgi:signal transduction histidine kinase